MCPHLCGSPHNPVGRYHVGQFYENLHSVQEACIFVASSGSKKASYKYICPHVQNIVTIQAQKLRDGNVLHCLMFCVQQSQCVCQFCDSLYCNPTSQPLLPPQKQFCRKNMNVCVRFNGHKDRNMIVSVFVSFSFRVSSVALTTLNIFISCTKTACQGTMIAPFLTFPHYFLPVQ